MIARPQRPIMKTSLALLATALALSVVTSAKSTNENTGTTVMLRAVIHVNFGDRERQEDALGNIENILKAVPTAQIEVVCHGKGINLVVTQQSDDADMIETLIKQGVQFAACENTMKKKAINQDALVAGVTTVLSGAVEVLRKQQEGYGYFRP